MPIEYCVEYKTRHDHRYTRSTCFKDKKLALEIAEKTTLIGELEKVRVVKQTRRTIKIFK